MSLKTIRKKPPKHIPYSETEYGFIYGSARVERHKSHLTTGAVEIAVHTPRTKKYPLVITVTESGYIKVNRLGEWRRQPNKKYAL